MVREDPFWRKDKSSSMDLPTTVDRRDIKATKASVLLQQHGG